MNRIIQILYHSKAAANDENTISDILSVSKKHNHQLGITGILCYSKNKFIQLLEGEETTVIQLYSRIIDDPRHIECRLLHINFTDQPLFSDWTVGYVTMDSFDSRIMSLLHDTNLQHDNRAKVQKMLKELVSAHQI